MLTILQSIQSDLSRLNTRVDAIEKPATNPSTGGASATPNPSAAATDAVKGRLAELNLISDDSDDAATAETEIRRTNKGKKSGRAKTAEDVIVREIDWPHFYVHRGHSRQAARYEDLTIPEFTFGYLSMITNGNHSPTETEHMLNHLRELMRDAMDFPWQNVRNFHGVLWNHFEMDRIRWRDGEKIQELRQVYARRTAIQAGTRSTPSPCSMFNRNACRFTEDHESRYGPAKHVCAWCLRTDGRHYKHSESDCERKRSATVSKNAPSKPPAAKQE